MVNFSVFNELSLPLPVDCCPQSKFGIFFQLLAQLKNKGINQVRMSEEFPTYNILPNTTFHQFMGQQQNRDFTKRLSSFISNSVVKIDTPIVKNENTDQIDIKNTNEYFYKNKSTDGGLACCDIWNTIAISFNSENQWDEHNIELTRKTLSDDSSILKKQITIKHASKTEHLANHADFFSDLERENRSNITRENFWENKDIHFPNIIKFCPEVKSQVRKLDKTIFKQAISILRDIETQGKSITDFNYSGESKTVCNNPELRKKREFTIKGQKTFMQNHIKSLPSGYRIYFLEEDKIIYIGYIRKHL